MKKKTLKDCKSLEEVEDEGLMFELINSKEFKDGIKKSIEASTWDLGLPKSYMDKDGWLVQEWKDGRIDRIKKLK